MMVRVPRIEDYDRVLAVEGYSDLLFYAEALEHAGSGGKVFIKAFNGYEDLAAKLEVFLSPGLLAEKRAIGVIVDADDDASARRRSLAQVLRNITGRDLEHGVWSPGPPRLGFFVTPDGKSPGEVETLVWRSWVSDPHNAPATACISSYLNCMEELGHTPKSPDKGRVSALLAVRNDDDPRLGPGTRNGVFTFGQGDYQPLLDFLTGLCRELDDLATP